MQAPTWEFCIGHFSLDFGRLPRSDESHGGACVFSCRGGAVAAALEPVSQSPTRPNAMKWTWLKRAGGGRRPAGRAGGAGAGGAGGGGAARGGGAAAGRD